MQSYIYELIGFMKTDCWLFRNLGTSKENQSRESSSSQRGGHWPTHDKLHQSFIGSLENIAKGLVMEEIIAILVQSCDWFG